MSETRYQPKIVKARLKTKDNKMPDAHFYDAESARLQSKADECLDGAIVYLALFAYDNHERYHLFGWSDDMVTRIEEAMYYATQLLGCEYGSFEEFHKIWSSEEYDTGCSYTFTENQVEILEVMQEEENVPDSRRTGAIVRRSKEEKMNQCRKDRLKRKQQWRNRHGW